MNSPDHRTSEAAAPVSGHPAAENASPATYPRDVTFLAGMDPDVRVRFIAWMESLDEESAKRGMPYGEGSLWRSTGGECWFSYFEDEMSPDHALDEDESNWDGDE